MDDVEERLVARPEEAVGEHVRVRVAAIAGDGVHGLDLLRPHLEQQLVRAADDLVLVHARAEHPVDLVVDRVDEARRLVEERDLLRRLDLAGVEEDLRAVRDVEPGAPQRFQGDEVRHVDPERLVGEPELAQLVGDLLGEPVGDARLDGHRASHRRDAGAEALLRKPGREQLVVAGGRAEVPEDGIGPAREEREAGVLVARPLADVRARDVADVVRVEEQDRAELRSLERRPRTFEPLPAQPRKVDALLPVHCPRRVG